MFIRTERSVGEFMRFYPIVSTIIIINIAVYILMYFTPHFISDPIRYWGIGFSPLVADGEYWRLFTPIFMHGDFFHMAFNSFVLILFGPALERMIGRPMFAIAYVIMGFLANLGTYFIDMYYTDMLEVFPHLGASTSLYGLYGVFIYMLVFRKDLIDRGSAQIILVFTFIGMVMTFIQPNVSVTGHLFGFVAGVLVAPLILAKARPFVRPVQTYRPRRHRGEADGVGFDPNRWQKKRIIPRKVKQNLLWIIIGAIVLIGIIAQYYNK